MSRCTAHTALPDDAAVYAALRDENTTKNLAVNAAKAGVMHNLTPQEKLLIGLMMRALGAPDDIPLKIPDQILQPDKGVAWSLDSQRKVNVGLNGFTVSEQVTASNAVNVAVGAGKVVIL